MKLPAVALASAFAAGILLGLHPFVAQNATSRKFLFVSVMFLFLAIAAGIVLAWHGKILGAALFSITAWVGLGTFAALLAQQPLPSDHILNRIAASELDLHSPLRWHGRLREEPARLPWGYSLTLDLASVEANDTSLAVEGGLRVGFTPKNSDPPFPELHTGDEIAVLAQGRPPQIFRDRGAFDRREFLAQQNIHLLATLRSAELLEKLSSSPPTLQTRFALLRTRLPQQLDFMFPNSPRVAGILRAMLLGDRSFVDQSESVDFQKTGVFHVLVVAGLHVGALAFFLIWFSRRLQLPRVISTVAILCVLAAYVAVVEQRPPVLRAALMTAIVALGSLAYRRLELLNSAALAALILLIAKPKSALDTSFQLSFLAIGCIAALALPWLQLRIQPYARALREWRDVTCDAAHDPQRAQFRLDLRDFASIFTYAFTPRPARLAQDATMKCFSLSIRIAEAFVLTLVLQWGMLPLMARDFHRVSLLGPFANLFAVPITGLIVPIGFVGLLLSSLFHSLAKLVALPLIWLVELQNRIVSFFANLPHSNYRIPAPPHWVVFFFFASALVLAVALRFAIPRLHWPVRAATCALFAAGLLVASYPFHPSTIRNSLEVDVLDVGQGDSILIISPRGSTLLIDGGGAFQGFKNREEHLGPDPGEDAVSAYLWSRGFQSLDAVAVTHAHQDHIGGLAAVLQNFRVGRVWLGRETAAPALAQFKAIADSRHILIEHKLRGQAFQWDGVTLEFLWPAIPPEEIAPSAKNNDSLVIRLTYGERSVLLPGDAEKQAEYAMLSENSPQHLQSDVLKIGHHGSKNSTMPEFLAEVSPKIAIVSAGEENPYGHPSPELLRRLEVNHVPLLRTDRQGAVEILTDGRNLKWNCFEVCPESPAQSVGAQPADGGEHN